MSERGQPIYLREDEVIIPRAQHEALMTDQWQRIRELEQHEALMTDQWQRIRELEAERDARVSVELLNIERETCDRIRSDNDRLRVERDWLAKRSDDLQTLANAIRAKTIEECLSAAESAAGSETDSIFAFSDAMAAIRALAHASTPFDKGSGAQQDESKTESGE